MGLAHEELLRIATGGKLLRSRLVHGAAGTPSPDNQAATMFGAAVNLLHGAFFIHDDVVDSDEIRRGEKTFAHSLTSAANSAHLGQSLAVLAGDLAIAEAIDLLNDPDVSPQLRAPATRIVIDAITESVHGEIADVAFRTTGSPHTIDDARADTPHDTWRIFIWANYVVGAVVCVTLVWVFAKG